MIARRLVAYSGAFRPIGNEMVGYGRGFCVLRIKAVVSRVGMIHSD